ncbi:MAG: LysM peptidoglycan-binding domain-containing protein [Patescibacteria group bacterium]|jgi:LysM repeat protein
MVHRLSKRLILVYLILIIGSAFLIYKNLTHRTSSASAISTNATSTPVPSATPTPTDVNEIYTVKQGDSLYTIGKQYNIQWTVLAKINGLEETSVLKVGDKLKIPTANENATVQATTDTVRSTQEETDGLASAQQYADAGTGQLAYRLNPVMVVEQSPLLAKYSFSSNDLYVLKSKDISTGVAVVEVTHLGKLHTVTLHAYQPNKGEKTVWTPVTVAY